MSTDSGLQTARDRAARAGQALLDADNAVTRKEFAAALVDLREQYSIESGKKDYNGRSTGYRTTLQGIYEEVGFDESNTALMSGVRYHITKMVRNRLREGRSEQEYLEQCRLYGIKPENPDVLRKTAQARLRAAAEGALTSTPIGPVVAAESTQHFVLTLDGLDELDGEELRCLRTALADLIDRLPEALARVDARYDGLADRTAH
ncbi:hypothetical protein JOD54_001093 [Actinokineospora baliensis]|uniref:hypothetical protein n=1 Tax=Actinokineospora baliensis TaxID=547056 RepID=UPI001959A1C8|nr:hypothetical protein [Actinokineospora baliensis]MBM7770889.1 hypothetical protein [Actinokineospora baliensis]